MDNVKNFYDMKALVIENLENSVCLEFNDLEQYLQKYQKMYQMYEVLEGKNTNSYKEKILTNVKILIDTHKNKIRNRLNVETENFAEISNDYSNFIAYLISLQQQYPEFKDAIEIDDLI